MKILKKLFSLSGKEQELPPAGESADLVSDEEPKKLKVDREAALRRFAQREDLYAQALRSVAADYTDIAARLRQLIGENRTDELRFVVHTLRGVMGNVGVEEIFVLCSRLEELVGSDSMEESAALVEELDGLMQCFFAYVNEQPGGRGEGEFVQVSCEKFVAVLEEIAPVVRSRRPRECREVVSRLKNLQLCQPELSKEAKIDQLISFIEEYEFDKALELITLLHNQKNK